jgi:hypothetical protein
MHVHFTKQCRWERWVGLSLILLWAVPCLAVDPGIYEGTWQARNGKLPMTITVSRVPQQVRVIINQQTLVAVEVSYVYGKSAAYPFLFLHAVEEAADAQSDYLMYEHALYLIIGALQPGTGRPTGILRGFYEFSKVKNDHHGTVETTSYPVELVPVASD